MRDKQRTDVLVISQLPPPVHGSTLMTQTFLRTLDTLGFSWFLVDRRFSTRVDQVGKFGFGKAFSAVGLWFRLATALSQQKPKVVVFFSTTRTFSFLVDWMLSELLRFSKAKTILYLHTVGYRSLAEQGRVWNFLVSRLLGAAHDIVVLDESLARDVTSFTDAHITAIPNTLPEEPHSPSKIVPIEDRNVILFLSNLIKGKGYEDFLEVAFRALNEGVNAEFVLAGNASVEVATSVRQLIEASSHKQSIRMVGAVDSERKWDLLHSAKLLVFLSKYEAFGLVLIEAAACGVPIVSYRTGALASKLAKQHASIVVEVGDIDELLKEIQLLNCDIDKLKYMSIAGQHTYETLFSRSLFVSNWDCLLRQLCILDTFLPKKLGR